MQNPLLSTATAASMTASELRAFGALAPRQLSLFCTRYAAAKESLSGSKEQADLLTAAKESYKRSCEDEHGQVMRVREVAAVVESRGAAQSATVVGGKNVARGVAYKVSLWDLSWSTR